MIIAMAVIMVLLCAAVGFAQDVSRTAQVAIKNYAFQPGDVTIARGGTVTWTNQDNVKHIVAFGSDVSPQLGMGQTYSKMFNQPGTFDYMCNIHPSMKGRVTVI